MRQLRRSLPHITPPNVFSPRHTIKRYSPYSITERRVPELIPVLGSQPARDVSHKPGGRLPLLFTSVQLPSQPLRGLLPVLLLGKQRHDGCEQFAYDCDCPRLGLIPVELRDYILSVVCSCLLVRRASVVADDTNTYRCGSCSSCRMTEYLSWTCFTGSFFHTTFTAARETAVFSQQHHKQCNQRNLYGSRLLFTDAARIVCGAESM